MASCENSFIVVKQPATITDTFFMSLGNQISMVLLFINVL